MVYDIGFYFIHCNIYDHAGWVTETWVLKHSSFEYRHVPVTHAVCSPPPPRLSRRGRGPRRIIWASGDNSNLNILINIVLAPRYYLRRPGVEPVHVLVTYQPFCPILTILPFKSPHADWLFRVNNTAAMSIVHSGPRHGACQRSCALFRLKADN